VAIAAAPIVTITLAPTTLPGGTVGSAYSQQITASGGVSPYTYTVSAGTLPAGLTLSSGGLLNGTPTASGSFTFTVAATDSSAAPGPYSGSQSYTVAIAAQTTTPDFTIDASKPAATVQPGSAAVFNFTVTPTGGAATFTSEVTLVATGLPSGATATFSPSSIAAGSAATAVTMTIQLPQTSAEIQPAGVRGDKLASRLVPFSLALFLLPFVGRLRKAGKRFSRILSVLLLLAAGTAVMAGMSGCGSTIGFFGQQQKSYTVTVTATSGTLSHFTNVTLTVE
jgi:hypothetical protein